MPARETAPPGTIPRHFPPRLGRLPQRKIFEITAISIASLVNTRQHTLQQVARKLAIAEKALGIIVDIAVDLIGQSFCQQALNNRNHFGDMLCGPWEDVGRENIDGALVIM